MQNIVSLPPKRKVTVKLPLALYQRIGREKYSTDFTIEEIIERRLVLSFEAKPQLERSTEGGLN